jgi:hypothetical protein
MFSDVHHWVCRVETVRVLNGCRRLRRREPEGTERYGRDNCKETHGEPNVEMEPICLQAGVQPDYSRKVAYALVIANQVAGISTTCSPSSPKSRDASYALCARHRSSMLATVAAPPAA